MADHRADDAAVAIDLGTYRAREPRTVALAIRAGTNEERR